MYELLPITEEDERIYKDVTSGKAGMSPADFQVAQYVETAYLERDLEHELELAGVDLRYVDQSSFSYMIYLYRLNEEINSMDAPWRTKMAAAIHKKVTKENHISSHVDVEKWTKYMKERGL